MKLDSRSCIISIALIVLASISPVFAQKQKIGDTWTGTLRDGTIIDSDDLKKILEDHEKWLDSYGPVVFKKADFQGSSLIGANLQETNLMGANLKDAGLERANLKEANLKIADLRNADLAYANLQGANLEGVKLKDAGLERANLKEANLKIADLRNADLTYANLQEANFEGANLKDAGLGGSNLKKAKLVLANLQGVNLNQANLQMAVLTAADLQKARLIKANLESAILHGANLKRAAIWEANLQWAMLNGVNLEGADLIDSNLKGAVLYMTNLKDSNLGRANLDKAIFEVKSRCLPYIPSIANAKELSSLTYDSSPHALVELRDAFKKSGLRKQEQEITYAIKHSKFERTIYNDEGGNLLAKIEVSLGWVFFGLTCKWGMSPERPIFILIGLIFVFMIPYALAISGDLYGKKKIDGIWRVWIPGRMRDDLGNKAPKELLDDLTPNSLKMGFYFSILSAFHFGWRDLNVGNWITRLQRYEYRLQATGWARTVSGLQSLISVYLLALSVLTYFGRPFESY